MLFDLLFNATPPTRTAQARARRMRETVASSGMKANLGITARIRKPRAPHIAASVGSVTSFRRQPCDRNLAFRPSALAGDGDVVVALAVRTIRTLFRHRSRDFIGIDAAIGRGLRKIA